MRRPVAANHLYLLVPVAPQRGKAVQLCAWGKMLAAPACLSATRTIWALPHHIGDRTPHRANHRRGICLTELLEINCLSLTMYQHEQFCCWLLMHFTRRPGKGVVIVRDMGELNLYAVTPITQEDDLIYGIRLPAINSVY